MPYKFFVFGGNSVYSKVVNSDLINNSEVYYYTGLQNRVLNNLLTAHYGYKVNKKFLLPFKGIWYKAIMPKCREIATGQKYFIFAEACNLSYYDPFLRRIKKEYPDAKLIFRFSNPPEETNQARLAPVRKYYDAVTTFCRDWLQDGWILAKGGYSKIAIEENDLPQSDLFFVGAAKDRLNLLLNIYEKATVLGLKCDFYITQVPEYKQVHRPGIVYNKYLDYIEVLQHVKKTSCILEVLKCGYSYTSIRTYEAITYGKKLLTTNQQLSESRYYNADNMHSITTEEDIRKEWFDEPFKPYNIDASDYSPNRFLEFISREV